MENKNIWITLLTSLSIATLGAGCGKQAFVVTQTQAMMKSPGSYVIPAKVDILLVQDDTGGVDQALSSINSQMQGFLTNLEAQGWNYHFATAKLTGDRPLTEILASKNDSNWGSEWVPAYPGQPSDEQGMLLPQFFRKPNAYTQFVKPGELNTGLGGWEPGFTNIDRTLTQRVPGTSFLRDDALLVVFVVGNGDDTSNVLYCNRGDMFIPCEKLQASSGNICKKNGQIVACPNFAGGARDNSLTDTFNTFRDKILSAKGAIDAQNIAQTRAKLRFYSAVSHSDSRFSSGNCLGGNSWKGNRYINMANELGGKSFDLCANSVATVLSALSGELESQKLHYTQRFLFLAQRPEISTVRVIKYVGGDPNQAVELQADGFNGWTYEDRVRTEAAIDSPIPMNVQTGYAIELHGSAKLVGNDTAEVIYKPYGFQNAH